MTVGLKIAGLIVSAVIIATVNTLIASALNTSLDLKITGIECTVDQIYDLPAPSYIVNPEDCTLPPISSALPLVDQNILPPKESTVFLQKTTRPEGNQGIFENTQFEPLARWFGVGNSSASPARPIGAASLLAGVTSFIVDGILFDFRISQAALGFIRKKR